MNAYEEELQRKIEAGLKPTGSDPDIQAYHEVFIRLKQGPTFQLSDSFPDAIIARIVERKKQSTSRDFYWLGAGTFLLVVSLIVAVKMSGFTPDLGFLKNMSGYAGLFSFSIVFIIILNLLDKKFIFQKRDIHSFTKSKNT